jgi:hypothetical protein
MTGDRPCISGQGWQGSVSWRATWPPELPHTDPGTGAMRSPGFCCHRASYRRLCGHMVTSIPSEDCGKDNDKPRWAIDLLLSQNCGNDRRVAVGPACWPFWEGSHSQIPQSSMWGTQSSDSIRPAQGAIASTHGDPHPMWWIAGGARHSGHSWKPLIKKQVMARHRQLQQAKKEGMSWMMPPRKLWTDQEVRGTEQEWGKKVQEV